MARARRLHTPRHPPTLEARRAEARQLAATGLSAREVAELLGYDRGTVRGYLKPDPPPPFDPWGPP